MCHGDTSLYISLRLHLHANFPSFGGFAGDKNIAFDFSDACLFGYPVYFDYQDFLVFALDLSFQSFNAGKS